MFKNNVFDARLLGNDTVYMVGTGEGGLCTRLYLTGEVRGY
jgi:hypothetical protein